MTDPIRRPVKLHHTLKFGKHKGKTLEWAIDNDLAWVKWAHKHALFNWETLAWDYFIEKLKGAAKHGTDRGTIYSRHKTR